jgi:hypothetical protein
VGQQNLPSNILDQIAELRRQLADLRGAVGLSSATITKGGLTIKGGAFFEMEDASGNLVAYIGPDPAGGPSQVFQLWRPGSHPLMVTQQDALSGRYFTAIRDYLDQIIFADDVQTGGMARPYLAVPMYPLFTTNVAAGSIVAYNTVNASAITSETALWEGRIPFGSHPRISIDGTWGQGSGSNNTTYKLYVAGGLVGTWTENGTLEIARKGPFDISGVFGNESIQVQLKAVSSGTGVVAAQVFGCHLRQT